MEIFGFSKVGALDSVAVKNCNQSITMHGNHQLNIVLLDGISSGAHGMKNNQG